MSRLWRLLALGLFSTALLHGGEGMDRTIPVDENDAAMNAAIQNARRTLPHFWAIYAERKYGETMFCLKVEIKDSHGSEHFWCNEIERHGTELTGVINNEPDIVHNVKFGQRITIKEDQISDWMYLKDHKMIGNYTLRVLVPSLTREERDLLVPRLGELPK